MVIQNLNFFDKFGNNLNLEWNDELEIWEGIIFFSEVSTYLYDNENVFILEKVDEIYKFPTLGPGESLSFKWKNNEIDEFFLYDVEKDYDLNNYFINKKESVSISYNDILPASGGSSIDLNLPLQINIAFNPIEEIKYERTLCVYMDDNVSPNGNIKIAEISFYGEGLDEDERFGVWARNFGIKFNKEDANILKEYDIKEAFPDWGQLNIARKSLLVNKDQVYPYIGTYKGLSNFINLMGYKDVLQVKEYWNNINKKSPYYDKKTLIDISDYLDDEKIDQIDILDDNKSIKFGNQFRKTECLALVYQFTKATDIYDDDGIPIVEETTDFTVDEMFFKLNKLGDKLKNEFLPVNVEIKDIIGEFIYFQKMTIKFWKDDSTIFDFDLNDGTHVESYPNLNTNLIIRNLSPLLRKEYDNGADFGTIVLNNGYSNPYEYNQKYPASHIDGMIGYIQDFYEEIKDQRYPDIGKRLTWEDGDNPEVIIGAPVIFNIYVDKFTFENFKGVTFGDLAGSGSLNPLHTLKNLDFKNFYEITWKIKKDAPSPYYFEFRGKIEDYFRLPHFLPYIGDYTVTAELHDLYGTTSVFKKNITVESDLVPQIIATTRIEDKFDYNLQNLSNVRLQDFGSSFLYYPKINVLDSDDTIGSIDISKNLQEWSYFYRRIYDVDIYDAESESYVNYYDPNQSHPKLNYWGIGVGDTPVKLEDLSDVTVDSLFFMRISDLIYVSDFNAGFYIRDPKPGQRIKISLFSEFIIPDFLNLYDLVNTLNNSNHPGLKLFNYSVREGKISDGQYGVHAQAKYLNKDMYHILSSNGVGSPGSPSTSPSNSEYPDIDKYTFFLPHKIYSERTINYLKSLSSTFDDETLFLVAKTSDMLNGYVQDPTFWSDNKFWRFIDNKQTGHLPTIMDQNSFNPEDIKVFETDFNVPENTPVFFTINNIDGKNDFVWTLYSYDTGEEVIRVKGSPFFIWKFKDYGRFTLKVDVYDNNGNIYSRQLDNFITVMIKSQYIKNIERRLNRRKNNLLK